MRTLGLLICFFTLVLSANAQFTNQPRTPEQDSLIARTQRKTRADHQNMMDQLGIKTLRPGANGSDPKAANAANYDESKANPFPDLPKVLVLKNGKSVKNANTWWSKRRPEIIEDFDREIYGRVPKNTPKVAWELISTKDTLIGNITVKEKKLLGHVDNSVFPTINVNIQLTVGTPINAKNAVPLIMEFGYVGFRRPTAATNEPNWQQQVLENGWAYAVLVPISVQADNGAGLTSGIIGLMNKGEHRKPDDWGALRAWAWGASRALDYFETDPNIEAKKVGIEGHSRYGKAALVTMAYDTRFAIGYISSSGAAGAKLHRRNAGEIVENVAGSGEYHWMAGNYIKYAGPLTWGDLPVDSHELIALCAPRPVFIGVGDKGDAWVDARGSYMAAFEASEVYKLIGKKGLSSNVFPAIETTMTEGEIGFRQHSGGHTPAPNWPTFITFAKKYWK
jgi:hypothetical protein